jgi:beta-lactamase regulating signal transducer with metallopeptidase domain/thiol-disulfide isomerase/thioredoxin/protocatechuate 3,4-dioxygenase beta subunit
MSAFSIMFEAGVGPVLVAKWTLVLALAWLVHAALAGRNPRWRVALWRGAMLGVGLIAALALIPPIVRVPVVPAPPPATAVQHEAIALPSAPEPAPRTIIVTALETPITPRSESSLDLAPASRPAEIVTPSTPIPIPAPSRPAESWMPYAMRLAESWAPWIWLAGALVLTVRLILAGLALNRMIARASAAPEDISRQCQAIAARLGYRGAIRARVSAEVATPCLAGVMRPVLLLPLRENQGDDLRAILAHELAHARHHDLAWNLATHLATIALWFHPLAWRIRGAHTAACDAVSDAVAADFVGDVASYGRTLARMAVVASSPAPVHVLAMARTSEVWRRLDALNRKVFRGPLSRKYAAPALGAGALLLILIGGLGVTRAGQNAAEPQRKDDQPAKTKPAPDAKPAPQPEAPATAGRIVLRAVEAATGELIEGVAIEYGGTFDGKYRRATVTTGEDGTAAIEWAPDAKIGRLWITARKPKLAPIHILWDGEHHPIRLPAIKDLRFDPGTTIGGIVKDEAGQPIAGAKVEVYGPPTESERAHYAFILGTLQTDAQGRWQLDTAPQSSAGVSASVSHPHYRRGYAAISHDLNSATTLKKGISVSGRVVDAKGQPIQGATAVLGHDRWGTNPPTGKTNERGEFTLENCDAGATIITVQADGFAPQIRDVRVEAKNEPVEVRMTEPGATIRGKVVDAQGQPVAGAFVAADTWRGHRSIEFRVDSDKDGRFEWRSAPKDTVLFDIGQGGYMSSRHVPLTASDREQTVTLYPKLTISGRVTDAATSRAVEKFRVVQGRRFEGRDQIYWSETEGADGSGGQFTSQFGEPSAALFVRVEAPGYKPAESRAFRSNEGRQTFDVALQPAAGRSGIVQLPDGSPVAGAEVTLATRENHVSLRSGRFDRNANVPRFKTGADGRFTFLPPDDRFLLIALSDFGFADASSDEFAKSGKLVMQPWGRIEGGVRIGARAGAGQEVTFQPTRPDRGGGIYVFDYGYTTGTDDRGRFVFDRVIPGPGTVSRVIITEFAGRSQRHMPGWNEPVDVKPGRTVEVKIGGKGRPVIGRVVLDGTPEIPVDWTQNEPATITSPPKDWGTPGHQYARFAAHIDRDGRFRIEDIPTGHYQLNIQANAVPDSAFRSAGTTIGRTEMAVTMPDVPGGRSSEPLDLGTITVKLFETIKAGDLAPDFTLRRIGGKSGSDPLKLSDFQGKLVLLDFWATWCTPCLGEMPALGDIQTTFGANPRFAMIGLSCDQAPESPEEYIRRNPMGWTQAFAGDFNSSVGTSYKLRAIPATFLIGPDGRILAKNLRGTALKEAVARALKDDSLFTANTWAPRPGRFPVTRFEGATSSPDESSAHKPLVAVLDDCDPDFQEDRPHRDALRIFRTADGGTKGEVVASTFPEFNTCQTVGGVHGVAIDRQRGRIYLCEMVANRVVALDVQGRKLWQVAGIDGGALTIDPRTGNLWCTAGGNFATGETVVLDSTGREVASFPVRGIDVAYDPHTEGFWLVGYGVTKLSREGKVLFHKPKEGWAHTSVAVDPRDGSVWIVERAHPDVARSANRLWHLDSAGGVIKMQPLGEKNLFAVACDPKTGTAWVAVHGKEILRFTADGRELPSLPFKARAVAVSPTTGQVWATTETELIGLDADGRPAIRSPIGPKSGQSWLAAY